MSITVVNSVRKSLNHSISISVIFFVFVLSLSYRELLLTVPVGYMRDLREAVIYVLAEFVRYGGGGTPFSAKEKNLLFFTLIFR